MEFVGFVLGFGLLAGMIAGIAAVIQVMMNGGLRERVGALEVEVSRLGRQLSLLERPATAAAGTAVPGAEERPRWEAPRPTAAPQPAPPPPPQPSPAMASVAEFVLPMEPPAPRPQPQFTATSIPAAPAAAATPAKPEEPAVSWEERVGRWLGWLAAVTVVLTAAFFIKWTYDIGWLAKVPVWAYVGLGWVTGAGFLAAGERFRRGLPLYGQGLTGAGIALLYVTTYAGHHYHVLEAGAATAGLALVGALAIWLALRHDSPAIGWIGIVLAYATPVVIGGGGADPTQLFLYLTALNGAVLAISVMRRWVAFRVGSFVASVALFVLWYLTRYSGAFAAPAVTFLWANWAIFVAVLAVYPLLRKEPAHDSDLALAALNPLFAAGFLYAIMRTEYPGWTGAGAALFSGTYWLLSRAIRTRRLWGLDEEEREQEERAPSPPDYLEQLFFAASVVFAALAMPLQLHGRSLTAAWALMGTALYVSGARTGSQRTCWWSAAPLALAVLRLPYADASLPASAPVFFNARGFSFGVVLISLLTVAATVAGEWLTSRRESTGKLTLLTLLTVLIGALLDWWIGLDLPNAWVVAGWAAVGGLGLAFGWRLRSRELRMTGLFLTALPLACSVSEPAWAGSGFAPANHWPGWLAVVALSLGAAMCYQRAEEEETPERWISPIFAGVVCALLMIRAHLDASPIWIPVAWAATAAVAVAVGLGTRSSGHRSVALGAALVAAGGLLIQPLLGEMPTGEWWQRAPGFAATLALAVGIAWSYLCREWAEEGEREAVGCTAVGIAAVVAMTWGGLDLHAGWLPLSWLAVIGALLAVGIRLDRPALWAFAVTVAAALSCEVVVRELKLPAEHLLLLHSRTAACLAALAAWVAVAWVVRRFGRESERVMLPALIVIANLHALGWISLEAMDLGLQLGGPQWAHAAAQLGLSAAWILYAAGALAFGFWKDYRGVRWGGVSLLFLAVGKVYLFDLSFLALGYRVLSFLILAVVLLGVSYLYQRSGTRQRTS